MKPLFVLDGHPLRYQELTIRQALDPSNVEEDGFDGPASGVSASLEYISMSGWYQGLVLSNVRRETRRSGRLVYFCISTSAYSDIARRLIEQVKGIDRAQLLGYY